MVKFFILIVFCYKILDVSIFNLHFSSIISYLNDYKINTSSNTTPTIDKSNSESNTIKYTQDITKTDSTRSENDTTQNINTNKNEVNTNQIADFDKDFNLDKINNKAKEDKENSKPVQNLDISSNNKQKINKTENLNTSNIDKVDSAKNSDLSLDYKTKIYNQAPNNLPTSEQLKHKNDANKLKEIPYINKSSKQLNPDKKSLTQSNAADITQSADLEKQQFIKNEILLLQLDDTDPFDDYLEDFKSYVHRFWKNYYDAINAPKAQDVAKFLKNYDKKYKSTDILPFLKIDNRNSHLNKPLNLGDAFLGAKEAIVINDFDGLRAWLDNFTVLNGKDNQGNNLLTIAVLNENILMGKFLLDRGINFNSRNNSDQSAYDIAVKNNDVEFIKLLANVKQNYKKSASNSRKK